MSKAIPKLRFKEYVGDWRKLQLVDVFSIFNGYAFASTDARVTGCRWVKIADVGINEVNHESSSFLPEEYKEKHSKYLLREGDYIVALTRPILDGKLKIAKVDKVLDGSLLNQRVGKLISENDLTFVYLLLQKQSLIARIENRIAGTDPPNLSPTEINSLYQFIPNLPEQQKVASFLSAVDEKIQQLTRKKELLGQYKKGVMQQLFSSSELGFARLEDDRIDADDKNNPTILQSKKSKFRQLRFKDENGKAYPKWEEKRLGEISNKKSSNIAANNIEANHGTYKIYGASGFLKYVDFYNEEEPFISIVKDGAGVGRTLLCDAKSSVLGTLDIIKPTGKIDLYFLYSVLNIIDFTKYSIGSTIPHIYFKDYSKEKIRIPSFDEQQKIANFLSAIDTKIESVATQIEKTQTFKKGLLQQMFV